MTFLDQFNPLSSDPNDPYVGQQFQTALANKYDPSSSTLQNLGITNPMVAAAMQQFDAQRVQGGQAPLNKQQTARAGLAAQLGQAVTPRPQSSPFNPIHLPGNLLHDLTGIVKSIPRIPGFAVKQVAELPRVPQLFSQALQGIDAQGQHTNPITALSQLPGLNLLPGSYIVGQAAQGGKGLAELARHPLFTALDALPFAEKAAAGTAVGEARIAEHAALKEAGQTLKPANPLKAVLTRSLDESGQLQPNVLGRASNALQGTRVGGLVKQTVGEEARLASRSLNLASRSVAQWLTSTGVVPEAMPYREVANIAKDITKGVNEFADLGRDRIAEITDRLRTDAPLSDLAPREQLYAGHYRELQTRIQQWKLDNNLLAEFNGEIYDLPTHQRLVAHDTRIADTQSRIGLRNHIANGTADAESVAQGILSTASGKASKLEQRKLINAHIAAGTAAGFDTSGLRSAARAFDRKGGNIADLSAAVDLFRTNAPKATVTSTEDLLAAIAPYKKTHPASTIRLESAVKGGRWQDALEESRRLQRAGTFTPDIADHIDSMIHKRDVANFTDKNAALFPTDAQLKAYTTRRDQAVARAVPARFMPLVEKGVKQTLSDHAMKVLPADEAVKATMLINDGLFSLVKGIDPEFVNATIRDQAKEWQALKDAGANPTFVHKISASQQNQYFYPKINEIAGSITSIRKRSLNLSPGVSNAFVSLGHEATELLAKHASEEFVDAFGKTWGRKLEDLAPRYQAKAEEAYRSDPTVSMRDHLDKAIKRDYMPFDPASLGYNWKSEKLSGWNKDQVWIPRASADVLKRWHNPAERLTGAFDAPLNAFRTAVLPLSPRWQVNNIIGGGMMTAVIAGPMAIPKYAVEAFRILKDGLTTQNSEYRAVLGMNESSELQAMRYMSGGTLRRRFDEINNPALNKLRDIGNAVIKKSFAVNGFFDDMYRTIAMLHGEDKYLAEMGIEKSTATEAQIRSAQSAGMDLGRQVLQQWTDLTPVERTVVRQVMPFYSFAQHITRFALNLAADHPWRAAIMSHIAEAELRDLGTGLPEDMLDLFFWGKTNKSGGRNAISLSGFNPFGSLPDYFTVQGFLGQTNPLISTALEQAGVQGGQADLYPNMHFDAQTGRMALTAPNPISSLIYNTIPQSKVVASLLGANAEFKALLARDPAAAMRQLASGVGIPVLHRHINIPDQYFRTELNALSSEKDALSGALSSGSDSGAHRYPELAQILEQYRYDATRNPNAPRPTLPTLPASVPASTPVPGGGYRVPGASIAGVTI